VWEYGFYEFCAFYDERIAEIEREKAEQQADIMRVMHEYTTYSMAEDSFCLPKEIHTLFLIR